MYDVGQVLYAVLTKKQKIVPVRVCEQIIRKSLDGEDVQYLIAVPGHDGYVNLDSLQADVFTNISEVKEVLKKRVVSLIDEMVDEAVNVARINFGQDDVHTSQSIEMTPKSDENSVSVVLENGTVANVSINNLIK